MRRSISGLKNVMLALASLTAAISLNAAAQAPAPNQPQISEGIVAIVNDEVITYSDVRQRARFILLSLGVETTQDTIRQAQIRAVEGLINEKLQLGEAANYDVSIDEEDIDAQLESLAGQSQSNLETFLAGLTSSGLNPRTLRDQIRAEIAWNRLVGGRFGSRVRISDLQIDDTIERLEKNLEETQYNISEIFLPGITQQEIAQVYEGALILKQQIESGAAPFEAVARQFSAAPTASSGGEIGWLGETQLKPSYADQIISMQTQGITEPVVTDNGVYLIALTDKQAPVEEKLSGFVLKEVSASGENAKATLSSAIDKISGCDALSDETAEQSNFTLTDLGETTLEELSAKYIETFSSIPKGSTSKITEFSGDKVAAVYVCSHIMTRGEMPTRQNVEDKLHGDMVDMMADRYLRDLRREATIIRR